MSKFTSKTIVVIRGGGDRDALMASSGIQLNAILQFIYLPS